MRSLYFWFQITQICIIYSNKLLLVVASFVVLIVLLAAVGTILPTAIKTNTRGRLTSNCDHNLKSNFLMLTIFLY